MLFRAFLPCGCRTLVVARYCGCGVYALFAWLCCLSGVSVLLGFGVALWMTLICGGFRRVWASVVRFSGPVGFVSARGLI